VLKKKNHAGESRFSLFTLSRGFPGVRMWVKVQPPLAVLSCTFACNAETRNILERKTFFRVGADHCSDISSKRKNGRDDNTFFRFLQFSCRWESTKLTTRLQLAELRLLGFLKSLEHREVCEERSRKNVGKRIHFRAPLNFPRPPSCKIFVTSGFARSRAAARGAQTLMNSFLSLEYRDQRQKGERTLASGSADESNRASRNSRTDLPRRELPSLRARALFATRIVIHRFGRAALAE